MFTKIKTDKYEWNSMQSTTNNFRWLLLSIDFLIHSHHIRINLHLMRWNSGIWWVTLVRQNMTTWRLNRNRMEHNDCIQLYIVLVDYIHNKHAQYKFCLFLVLHPNWNYNWKYLPENWNSNWHNRNRIFAVQFLVAKCNSQQSNVRTFICQTIGFIDVFFMSNKR